MAGEAGPEPFDRYPTVTVKILNISHGHPDRKLGGAEVGSYHLHRELLARSGVDSCYLAAEAGSDSEAHAHTPFATENADKGELLFLQPASSFNYRLFAPKSPTVLLTHFADFLHWYRPDIVHFHHFIGIGLPAIRVVRNVLPRASIFLTLYEYLAICPNDGQLVKRGSLELCHGARPRDCHRCFPEVAPPEFLLRELFVKSHFDLVDRFIASSEFIKGRYVDWGLPEARIEVLDNGFPRSDPAPPRRPVRGEGRGRFAFFGQLNPYKGVLTLLRAFKMLPPSAPDWITLDVHGGNLHYTREEFQRDFEELLAASPRVTFHGPYENRRMGQLMSDVDWTIVPSIWWENSPLVIQESNIFGRPVIASNIGGMAEKVLDGVNGLTFEVGSPEALKRVVLRASTEEGLWERLAANVTRGPWVEDIVDSLLESYQSAHANGTQRVLQG